MAYLDSFRVDLKGFSAATYRKIAHISNFIGILENVASAKYRWGMHIELITNLIPGYNDNRDELRDMARWIARQLGSDTPWHITRFIPHFKLSHLHHTPIPTMEQARQIGIDEGLRHVYFGNVPGHKAENTYCPLCGTLLIERRNYQILTYNLKGNACAHCGEPIAGYFE